MSIIKDYEAYFASKQAVLNLHNVFLELVVWSIGVATAIYLIYKFIALSLNLFLKAPWFTKLSAAEKDMVARYLVLSFVFIVLLLSVISLSFFSFFTLFLLFFLSFSSFSSLFFLLFFTLYSSNITCRVLGSTVHHSTVAIGSFYSLLYDDSLLFTAVLMIEVGFDIADTILSAFGMGLTGMPAIPIILHHSVALILDFISLYTEAVPWTSAAVFSCIFLGSGINDANAFSLLISLPRCN